MEENKKPIPRGLLGKDGKLTPKGTRLAIHSILFPFVSMMIRCSMYTLYKEYIPKLYSENFLYSINDLVQCGSNTILCRNDTVDCHQYGRLEI